MSTRKISTRLAIEGESEYRSSVQKINGELKSLQSALKLVQSEYQNNANSMEALSAKHDALKNLYDAQKEKVVELGKALENARSAEAEYARQKEELRQKIEANQRAMEALQGTAEDTAEQEKALADENKRLNGELSACEGNLDAAQRGVSNWENQLNNAQIRLTDLDAELKLNDEYLDEARESADGCATSIDRFGERVQNAGNRADDFKNALAAAGVIAALKATADALMDCVNSAAAFEQTMSGVAAISGATGAEVDALSAKAKELGATTVYTADEAGQAMSYMAMAGWDAQQMLDGMDGVLQLAAASGEDLALVSDIVTDSLTGFGLSAADTAHFADVLAATAANANTNVAMMGETFKYAAPLAGALGFDVEDVAVATGLMANSGIKASEAGTSLRNLFTRMAKPTKESAEAMEALGLSLTDDEGHMLSFMEIMERMRDSFSGLTEEQQAYYAAELGGQRAMSGLLAIVNASEGDFKKLAGAIDSSTGAAKRMADVKLDNYAGSVTLLESAWDGLKITVGEKFTPILRGLVDTGTSVLGWLTDMIEDCDWLGPVVSALATGIGILAAAIGGATIAMKLFTLAMNVNPIFLAVTAVTALAGALAVLVATSSPERLLEDLATASGSAAGAIEESNGKFDDAAAKIMATDDAARRYIDRLGELETAGLETAEQQEEYHNILRLLCETVPELADYIDLENDRILGTRDALLQELDARKKLAIYNAFDEKLSTLYQKQADLEVERAENSYRYTEARDKATQAEQNYADKMREQNELLAQAREKLAGWNGEQANTADVYEYLMTSQDELARSYRETLGWLNEHHDAYTENARLMIEAEGNARADEAAIAAVGEEIKRTNRQMDDMTEALGENTSAAEDNAAAQAAQEAAIEGIREKLGELAESYKEAYDAAYSSISGQVGLFDSFKATADEATDSVEEMMAIWTEQAQNVAAYTENLKKAAEYGISDGLVAQLSDGSAQSAAYLQTIISKIEELGGSTEGMSEDAAAFLEDFNAAFEGTQTARESFAETVAGIQTDLEGAIEELRKQAAEADFSGFAAALEEAFAETPGALRQLGVDAGTELSGGLESTRDVIKTAAGYIEADMREGGEAAKNAWEEGAAPLEGDVGSQLDALRAVVTEKNGEIGSAAQQGGTQFVDGWITGIVVNSPRLYSEIQNTVDNAIETARRAADSHSPSRKMIAFGEDMGEGAVIGWESKRAEILGTAQSVIDDAMELEARGSARVRDTLSRVDGEMPLPAGMTGGAMELHHSGSIRVEGVSDEGQLVGVTEILMERLVDELRREVRV